MGERPRLSPVVRALFAAHPDPLVPVTSDATAPSTSASRRRRRIWELEEKHLCPVVGSCLSLSDLKKLARQGGFRGECSDAHRLHAEAVALAGTRNEVSERMQSMLERKYTPWLKRYAALRKDSEVLERWREDLAQGEVPGAMWAALTHPAASEGTRSRIHADVHMLSHQLVAGQAEALRRVARLEQNNAQAERRLAELARRHAETMAQARDQLQSLQRECHRLQAEARQMEPLRERLARFESGQIMVDLGRRLFMLEAANADLRARVTRLKELETSMQALQIQLASLAKARDAIAAERDALEYLLLADETASEACAGDCVRCPEWLRGRCVLCVGGRTALLAQYRRLAERLGVRLIHHDGGREDALSRLPELLGTADAVICPTDSISHAAYGQLKRHCKHTRKPCVLARTSGIAGFAAALARLAEGRADQRNQLLHMEA